MQRDIKNKLSINQTYVNYEKINQFEHFSFQPLQYQSCLIDGQVSLILDMLKHWVSSDAGISSSGVHTRTSWTNLVILSGRKKK